MINLFDGISIKNIKITWYLFAFSLLVLDQITKYFVIQLLSLNEAIEITPFFNIVHFRNEGAAFSFLADAGGWQRYFLAGVASIVSILLFFIISKSQSRIQLFGYSLILGGALGNLIDRLLRGNVVDFLNFHWRASHWPTFNVADVIIFCGALVIVLLTFRSNSNVVPTQEHLTK